MIKTINLAKEGDILILKKKARWFWFPKTINSLENAGLYRIRNETYYKVLRREDISFYDSFCKWRRLGYYLEKDVQRIIETACNSNDNIRLIFKNNKTKNRFDIGKLTAMVGKYV